MQFLLLFFLIIFFQASTDEERQRTKDLILCPIFMKLNDSIARDFPGVQLGFFVLVRNGNWKDIKN